MCDRSYFKKRFIRWIRRERKWRAGRAGHDGERKRKGERERKEKKEKGKERGGTLIERKDQQSKRERTKRETTWAAGPFKGQGNQCFQVWPPGQLYMMTA